MQFYLAMWIDSGCTLTLSKLGEWERDNPQEYETYLSAYVHKVNLQIEQNKKLKKRQNMRRRR